MGVKNSGGKKKWVKKSGIKKMAVKKRGGVQKSEGKKKMWG